MELTECVPGTFVKHRENGGFMPDPNVGQIMSGLAINSSREPVVFVQWAQSSGTTTIHPGNLELYRK